MFNLRIAAATCVLLVIILSSCDTCKKLAKSKNIADKDSAAHCYYRKKQYESAATLFEELTGLYRGSAKIEKATFYYAMSKFYMREYLTASYHFQEFVNTFPLSTYVEEAYYMIALSYYAQSSEYYLDQSETIKAIEFLHLYLQRYPKGFHSGDIGDKIIALRTKLALKAFKQADLYHRVDNHKSAVIAFKNVIADHPDSPYREESHFKLFKSAYLYAQQSIFEKQEERYLESIGYYLKLVDKFPESKFKREAENLYANTQNALEKIKIKRESELDKKSNKKNKS